MASRSQAIASLEEETSPEYCESSSEIDDYDDDDLSIVGPENEPDPSDTIIKHSVDGNAEKSAFRTRLEGILNGIINTVKETSFEAIPLSAFSRGFFFYILNCDKSGRWETILNIIEQGTPIEIRDILGKPSITHDDLLALPLITKNHQHPGFYLN
jgi:hypothetical protein